MFKSKNIRKKFLNRIVMDLSLGIRKRVYIKFMSFRECIKYGKLLQQEYNFYCENPELLDKENYCHLSDLLNTRLICINRNSFFYVNFTFDNDFMEYILFFDKIIQEKKNIFIENVWTDEGNDKRYYRKEIIIL